MTDLRKFLLTSLVVLPLAYLCGDAAGPHLRAQTVAMQQPPGLAPPVVVLPASAVDGGGGVHVPTFTWPLGSFFQETLAGKMLFGGATTPVIQMGCTTSSCASMSGQTGGGSNMEFHPADSLGTWSTVVGALFSAQSAIVTHGVQTGVSYGTGSGRVLPADYDRVTITSAAFICAATTCDITLVTLPAKTSMMHVSADLTQTFACASTCTTSTLSMVVGKTAGGNEYLLSFDADAATGQFGLTAATLGASLAPATTQTLLGDFASWSGTTNVVLRLTSGTGNIGTGAATNLSQGSVTVHLAMYRPQ